MFAYAIRTFAQNDTPINFMRQSNNLDDIKYFFNDNKFNGSCEDDDFFCFGAQLGQGTDESHFINN